MKNNPSLSAKNLIVLFLFGLVISGGAALLQKAPGYMDAEYYFAGGVRLAQGHGLTQNFLWNYLDQPAGLPHPSHTYWMPLPSLVAALGMIVAASETYLAARIFFVLLAALLAPLTAFTTWQLMRDRTTALLAGFFALFPGFYLVYTTTTETITLYMILGTIFLLAASNSSGSFWRYLLMGLAAGGLHMTRADGLLWAAAGGLVILAEGWQRRKQHKPILQGFLWAGAGLLMGYFLVSGFWYGRNLRVFGTLLPPGGSLTLWLTDYNQTFLPTPAPLTFSNWLDSGLFAILQVRFSALWNNLQTFVAVQSGIFLLPFMLGGLWKTRSERITRLAVGLWVLTLGVMSVVFPFAGMRGGFLHSGAAFQPLFWAWAMIGLRAAVNREVQKRKWHPTRAYQNFGMLLIFCAAVMTLFLFTSTVIGGDPRAPLDQKNQRDFQQISAFLKDQEQPLEMVMINDSPGFTLTTGIPSIVIPYGSLAEIDQLARRYGATYLVIQTNHVPALDELYTAPQTWGAWIYLGQTADAQIYHFRPEGG